MRVVAPLLASITGKHFENPFTFLMETVDCRSNDPLGLQELHEQIHALKNQLGLPPKQAFSAIYLTFLGKPSGPQAGWFLAALDRDFVVSRLQEAAGAMRAGPR